MLRPFGTYAELARRPGERWQGLAGPLRWLLVIGCFVSLTSAARIVVDHMILAPLSWALIPFVQSLWIVAIARLFRARLGWRAAVELYFVGHGPWLSVLALVAGVCLIAPEPWPVFRFLLSTGALPLLALVATAWCVLLTYALFRSAFALGRAASLAATASFYTAATATFAGYFLVTGQLLPLFGVYG